ncbi:MAG: ATP-binding protein [Gemmatimonadota bacterium]
MSKLGRSFRGRLALRFGATVMLVAAAGSLFGYLVLRSLLIDQLDRTLLRLAGIEAAAAADTPDSTVHFHDEVFLAVGPGHKAILSRYAEVWSLEGEPVLRTENLAGGNLPLDGEVRSRVVSTGDPELFSFEWGGTEYRSVLYPLGLVGPQHEPHLLQVAAATDQTRAVLGNFLKVLAVLAFLGALAGLGLGWWVAGSAIRPVMEITRQAESLEMSRGKHRIIAQAETEEMSRLVSVLNSMLGRIDTAFESQRRFLADVGHEIRTPLTVLRGDVEVALRRHRSLEEYEAILGQTLEDLKDVSALADDLITLARGESGALTPEFRPIQAENLLREVAERYQGAAEKGGACLKIGSDPSAVVVGDRTLLARALGNLVDNAIKYGGDGEITVGASLADHGSVEIRVADEGPGVLPDELPHLFDRFVRGEAGRRVGRGSGLGLSIVKAIVESHGGTIQVDSVVGRGTTFRLHLPAVAHRQIRSRKVDVVGTHSGD